MALTDEQIAFYRRKLGSNVDLVDVEARLPRLEMDDRAVVLEVQEERLATLVSAPASFTVPGEYSQDTRENIKQLQREIADARAELLTGEDAADNLVEVQAPYYAVPIRVALDTEEFLARGRRRTRGR